MKLHFIYSPFGWFRARDQKSVIGQCGCRMPTRSLFYPIAYFSEILHNNSGSVTGALMKTSQHRMFMFSQYNIVSDLRSMKTSCLRATKMINFGGRLSLHCCLPLESTESKNCRAMVPCTVRSLIEIYQRFVSHSVPSTYFLKNCKLTHQQFLHNSHKGMKSECVEIPFKPFKRSRTFVCFTDICILQSRTGNILDKMHFVLIFVFYIIIRSHFPYIP